MVDVGTVVALALQDKALRPNGLLNGAELDSLAEDFSRRRLREPGVIDTNDTVPGTKNDIDIVATLKGFAQPVGEGQLGLAADGGEEVEGAHGVFGANKDVEVFGIT